VPGPPVQIAYAVDDVVAAAAGWAPVGVGPFFVREHIDVYNVRVRGEASVFDHSSAYGQWGSMMIELICQHDPGADPIVPHAGLHHVAHMVDDFAAEHQGLIDDGHAEVLYAETSRGMPFAMHDGGRARGHLIEIYEGTAELRRFYDMVRDASIGWTGADPIRHL
jgi:hypothetical protein